MDRAECEKTEAGCEEALRQLGVVRATHQFEYSLEA